MSEIPRYDGFCLVPDHLKNEQVIGNFYNRYQPFLHQPLAGEPTTTLIFLNHIFGSQLNLGLDYLKILLLYPMQVLPILCLLSTERNTGKTTFLNFLKALFGDNMTINRNDDFRSNFNSEWANKLIIGVDETFLDRKEDSEKIKSLSTSKNITRSNPKVRTARKLNSSESLFFVAITKTILSLSIPVKSGIGLENSPSWFCPANRTRKSHFRNFPKSCGYGKSVQYHK